MTFKPFLIGAAGLVALHLLTVRAAPSLPAAPPKGWSVSETIGKQYRLGYDAEDGAYFIESAGEIGPAGRAVNAGTDPGHDEQRVPYSAGGLKPDDPWAASMLQSVQAAPYRKHKVRFEAKVKSDGFKGKFRLMLRAFDPNKGGYDAHTTAPATLDIGFGGPDFGTEDLHTIGWQGVDGEIDMVPEDASVLSFGFLMQGQGRVLIRNVKLTSVEIAPAAPPPGTDIQDMFADPPANAEPVNPEMRP